MPTSLDSLSKRGLFEAMAEVIIEAGEVSGDDRGETVDIKVAYCVFGTHYRQEFRAYDNRTVRANVLRKIREDNPDVDGFRGWLEFEYDGMTFMLQDEDAYADTYQNAVDCIVEDARDNFEYAMNKADCYVSSYVKFDEEAFIRDLEYGGEVDTWIASYDGAVNDIHTTDGWFKAWRID